MSLVDVTRERHAELPSDLPFANSRPLHQITTRAAPGYSAVAGSASRTERYPNAIAAATSLVDERMPPSVRHNGARWLAMVSHAAGRDHEAGRHAANALALGRELMADGTPPNMLVMGLAARVSVVVGSRLDGALNVEAGLELAPVSLLRASIENSVLESLVEGAATP